MIVELKGKLNFEKDQKLQELIDVLINLGYDSKKAIDVASEIDLKKLSLEDAVKESLKKLTNN